jgi:hypothetical protein
MQYRILRALSLVVSILSVSTHGGGDTGTLYGVVGVGADPPRPQQLNPLEVFSLFGQGDDLCHDLRDFFPTAQLPNKLLYNERLEAFVNLGNILLANANISMTHDDARRLFSRMTDNCAVVLRIPLPRPDGQTDIAGPEQVQSRSKRSVDDVNDGERVKR